MKIDELITELESVREEHGNLEVKFNDKWIDLEKSHLRKEDSTLALTHGEMDGVTKEIDAKQKINVKEFGKPDDKVRIWIRNTSN